MKHEEVSDALTRGRGVISHQVVQEFLNVATQTLVAPMVTTLLFLAIFTLALGGAGRVVEGVDFARFLAPGLIMMSLMQNSFANTSSSLVMAKVQGNIVHQVGLPWHYGWVYPKNGGDSANILTPAAGDPNTRIPETKAFMVNVKKA